MTTVLALGRAEWKLLLRNKTVAMSATLMPLLMGFFLAYNVPPGADARFWAMQLALQLLCVQGLTIYFTVTTALTSRREDLYLKRLRSGEASTVSIVTGLLMPVIVLGIAQMVAMVAIALFFDAPIPANPLLLVAAMLGGTVLSVLAGVTTSGRTSTPEQAQITTLPWFFALLGGALWVSTTAKPTLVMLAVPGGALAELVRWAMTGEPLHGGLLALAALGVWIGVLALLSRLWFRWEPRS